MLALGVIIYLFVHVNQSQRVLLLSLGDCQVADDGHQADTFCMHQHSTEELSNGYLLYSSNVLNSIEQLHLLFHARIFHDINSICDSYKVPPTQT